MSDKYVISMIPYANVGPYRALGPPAHCIFRENTPRASTLALKKGEVLADLIPVGDLPSVTNEVEFLGDFGIAAVGKVESVILVSDCPLPEVIPPQAIHLTDHSSSSVRLLYLLLGYYNGFANLPLATTDVEAAAGRLIIGDAALLFKPAAGAYVLDLGEAWYQRTGLPFVYARWVVRRDAPLEFKKIMADWLAEFQVRELALRKTAAKAEGLRLGVPEQRMASYLDLIKLTLTPSELAGQQLFLRELTRHQRLPLFKPLADV